jgi:hypothetical protein
LFNKLDKISPIKRYYYNEHGEMAWAGRKKGNHKGVREHIERAERHLILA